MEQKPDLSKLVIDRSSFGKDDGKRARRRLVVIAIIALAGGSAFYLAQQLSSESKPTEVTHRPAATPISEQKAVNTTPVLNATGYVVAQRRAAIASKATGRLVQLNVEEGDTVEQDQVVGVIENEDMKAVVSEMTAQVGVLKARVQFAEAELEDSRLKRERVERLHIQRAESREQLDQAIARFNKAVAEVNSATAGLALGEAQLVKAKVDLGYTEIRAPFSGKVLTKDADIGEIVAPFGSSSTARAAIVSIADMDSLEVEADVSESNLGKVFVGQRCTITLDSLPGVVYRGEVKNIVPTVDRAKATVLTKIKFTDKDSRVIPEMSAKVAFELKEK